MTLEDDDRLRVSAKEAGRLLSISTRHLAYRTANKQISTVRDGRRVLYTLRELRRYAYTNRYDSPRKKAMN
ncbi:MAG: hypothetical protein ACP5E2_15650 [Terracidiphilus sp.]